MKSRFLLFLFSFVFISCDPATGVLISNSTDSILKIEYSTQYDDIVERNEESDTGKVSNYVNLEYGYFTYSKPPIFIDAGKSERIFSMIGFDLLYELDLGTIETEEDIVFAFDNIFNNISVYQINQNGEKKMLYDKSYFLRPENFSLKGGIIEINIR